MREEERRARGSICMESCQEKGVCLIVTKGGENTVKKNQHQACVETLNNAS